jgi:hypothetical protein
LVTTIFIGMAITFTHMYHGHSESEEGIKDPSTALIKNLSRKEPFWSIAPPFALLILIILLGVYLPMPLAASLNTIAEVLGKK